MLLNNLVTLPAVALAIPVTAFGFPNSFPPRSSSLSPSDALAVRNTISTYALAVDGKEAALLASLFTKDAIATFTSPDQTVVGGSAIAAHDLDAFSGLNTFHDLSTQVLSSNANGSVSATTYFAATIFGKDCYQGQVVTASGRYLDTLVRSNGSWAISERHQIYANPEDPYIGNVAIVLGPACNSTSA